MSTPSRTEINQANAQHSTGPKTEAGKQRSSLNALRHGLTGQLVVMPTEDLQIYQRHLTSFTDEYHPEGATEAHLVQALSDTAWRLNRVAALEANLLTLAAANQPSPFADAPAQVQDAMAIVASLESQSKALANLSLHSQRLSRQFERTVTQLRELQQTRHSREKQEVDDVLDIMEMYEAKGETYRPSDDGFVFSQTQIHAAIRTRNRERLIEEAHEFDAAA
jgi:cysteinyl-tRNA synthetase